MKRQKTVLIALLLALNGQLLSAFAQTDESLDGSPFSVSEAVAYALKNNVNAKNANLDIRDAKEVYNENLAIGLPQINANANFDYNILSTQFFPVGLIDPTSPNPDAMAPFPFEKQYGTRAGVSARQLLFDGRFFLGLKAAKVYQDLSLKKKTMTDIEVAEGVTKAYYAVLVNYELKELAESNYARLDTLLTQTEHMLKNGFAEQIDYDRIKVQHNNTKNQLDVYKRSIITSEALLKFQMNLPFEEEIVLTDELDESILPTSIIDPINSQFDYSKRIEYLLLEEQIRLEQVNLKAINVQYIPTLYLSGYFNQASNGKLEPVINDGVDMLWGKNYGVGVTFSWEIFDGFRKRAQAQQSKIKLMKQENERQNLEKQITYQQLEAKVTLQNNRETYLLQKENMDLARDVYNITKKKYQQGVGSNQEVVDAETSLKEAETTFYRAVFNTLMSTVEYKKAVGVLMDDYQIEE